MDYWPADERSIASSEQKSAKKKGKGNAQQQHVDIWQYPHLDYGTIGGATLVAREGRMRWTTALDTSDGMRPSSRGASVTVFPETRSPPLRMSNDYIVKRAQQGPHFLRTYIPDVDFPAELMKEELEADATLARDLSDFDPYSGNLLEVVPSYQKQDTSFVLFPMGEFNSDLINEAENSSIFEASGRSSHRFETPIQHIVPPTSISLAETGLSRLNFVLVRTMSATSMVTIDLQSDTPQVSRQIDIFRSDMGDRSVVDSKISSTGSNIILVNDHGHIHRCSVYPGGKAFQSIQASKSLAFEPQTDSFWRLGLTAFDQGCYLASCKSVGFIDFRSNDPFSDVYSIKNCSNIITSIEPPALDHSLRLVTTSEIIWLDNRFRRRPLLSFKHSRQRDRTLEARTVYRHQSPLTFLTSRKSGLVTVYSVARHVDNLVRCTDLPTYLPCHGSMYAPTAGHSVFVRPSGDDISLLKLSPQGSVHRQDLRYSTTEEPAHDAYPTHRWSTEVQALDRRAATLQPDSGHLEDRELSEINLHGAFSSLLLVLYVSADEFDGMLKKLAQFWQSDVPTENMLTGFDVTFRTGSEPGPASRADFLTEGTINNSRGYQALIEKGLPIQQLVERASWHHNLRQTISHFSPDLSDNWRVMYDRLGELDLDVASDRPASSVRREVHSREQLVLDLALASDVFSAQSLSKSRSYLVDHGVEVISTGTEGLSLSDEPPEVQFGHLRPVHKARVDHYIDAAKEQDGNAPRDAQLTSTLGVRLLLAEWEVGADTETYNYRDPYDESCVIQEPALRRKRTPPPTPGATQSTIMPSQRPPLVVAAAPPRPTQIVDRWQPSHAFSQGMEYRSSTQMSLDAGTIPSSQDFMASTQVLPGVHGGRATLKKPAKKRLGGPSNPWFDRASVNDILRRNKSVVCALSASYISTFAGYPLDSLKSRLQTTKTRISVVRLAGLVYREEGVKGFYRGLWIPLMTISFVRAASFTIYSGTKDYCRNHQYFNRNRMVDAAMTGGISGALSGSLISFGSAPFELVKVRRQLEYTIAASKGINLVKPPNTMDAVREIFRRDGLSGLYTGFSLHFLRDTAGTALYFFEYDAMRHLLGRQRSGEQGPTPLWLPIPVSLIPFVCGSLAGVTSWALIYPLDVVKTKVQQRALAGTPPRGVWDTLRRLVRGPDPNDPKPILAGVARIYRGLGVSAVRSLTTHGLLWTFFDITSHYIDHLP
ncbi:hypothetical protein BV22DRAFT_1102220 [Leucogyrophana mollusca]|uniref:Uncharacterized protein n=1 Tax=Leucogyrophana mollusca TaxID=85980 RepID=A0ACB8BUT3_9AGAM|nr:hypothetical protein BV22DRAFT_1102220 [Leucogyrophana mollusca]